MNKKLFIIVNVDRFFLSHRKEVGIAANKIYDVTIIAKDTGKRGEIESLGLKFINLPIDRSGTNPIQELKTFSFLYKLYKKEAPDLVHHVGLKVILWGSLAAKLARVRAEVNAISGLGVFFSEESKSLIGKILPCILKFSHNRNKLSCIFQNEEDKTLFLENSIINSDQVNLIKGSGVNLSLFTYTKELDTNKVIILFTGRMIKEKGILVLVDAAKKLKETHYNKVEFWLCGGVDDNPTALSKSELDGLCDGEYIQWLGFRTDVLDLLKQCHIVAFPSYYKEGLPKSLIEATAVGRPIVTTDSIGCRETVIDGVNGYLVPIKNSDILAHKLSILIEKSELRKEMGVQSRRLAEKYFSLDQVIKEHLEIYNKLLQ